MPEAVDAQLPSPLTPDQQSRLDGIRQLDSQIHSAAADLDKPGRTFYDQHDAEVTVDTLATQLSEKTGIPNGEIISQLKEERRLQAEIDIRTDALARTREQKDKRYETIVRTEARPLRRQPDMINPLKQTSERFHIDSRPAIETAPGRFGGGRGAGPR